MPVADIAVADGEVLATGDEARVVFEAALDDWLLLTAAALVGIGAQSLEIGVEYVKERKAFDVPIGSFQAVSHRLADSATALDGARLLTYEAAWAAEAEVGRASELAAMAFAFAGEAARDASYRSPPLPRRLWLHDGVRHPAVLASGPGLVSRLGRTRRRLPAGGRRPLREAMMDFRLGTAAEDLRGELRGFLDEVMTHDFEEGLYRSGVSHDPGFTQSLIDQGWFAPAWPTELGGPGLEPASAMVIGEELNRHGAPIYGTSVSLMIAKTLVRFGTDEMRRDVVPAVLRGETICVLGFTEPEAGSDVANAQTRAVRDGDEWVINGSKMFTTNAQIGDYVYLLTRTNPDVPKHKGLTTFLVPLDREGIEVQGVYTLSGERTNITYYNDVRVPDAARIGDVDGGWRVLTSSLMDEQASSFGRVARPPARGGRGLGHRDPPHA